MAIPDYEGDTAVFLASERFSDKFFDPSLHGLQFEFGAATHLGNVRPNNEDHLCRREASPHE